MVLIRSAESLCAGTLRARMVRRKRKARPRVVAKPQPPEQITIPVAQKRADRERFAWKGGFSSIKNIPEEWDGDE